MELYLSPAGCDFVNSSKTKIRVNLIFLNEVQIVKSQASTGWCTTAAAVLCREGIKRAQGWRWRMAWPRGWVDSATHLGWVLKGGYIAACRWRLDLRTEEGESEGAREPASGSDGGKGGGPFVRSARPRTTIISY